MPKTGVSFGDAENEQAFVEAALQERFHPIDLPLWAIWVLSIVLSLVFWVLTATRFSLPEDGQLVGALVPGGELA